MPIIPSGLSPRAAVLACVCVAGAAPAQSTGREPALRVERLAPTLHRITGGPAGSMMVLSGDDGLLLVDARDTAQAPQLDSAVAAISPRPVRLVINTHYHDDHIGGNARWRARGAVTLAHRNVVAQARKDTVIAEWENWRRSAAPAAALPMVDFTDSLTLRANGEEIVVLHPGPAHTDGDAVVWFRRANVVHAGDIVELGAYPFVDWWAGGSLQGMLAAVDRILALADDRTRIAPGHGPVTDRAGVRAYRAMLATVGERVAGAVAEGKTREQVVAMRPTREFDARHGGEQAGRDFTALVYTGLKRSAGARD